MCCGVAACKEGVLQTFCCGGLLRGLDERPTAQASGCEGRLPSKTGLAARLQCGMQVSYVCLYSLHLRRNEGLYYAHKGFLWDGAE